MRKGKREGKIDGKRPDLKLELYLKRGGKQSLDIGVLLLLKEEFLLPFCFGYYCCCCLMKIGYFNKKENQSNDEIR